MAEDVVTITLTKQISAHGEQVTALSLREPTGKDLRTLGYPFRFEGPQQIVDAAVIVRFVSALAGVPTSSVDQLCPADWNAAMGAVLGFFKAATRT